MTHVTVETQTAQLGRDTIFGNITSKEIPTNIIYEDDQAFIEHFQF